MSYTYYRPINMTPKRAKLVVLAVSGLLAFIGAIFLLIPYIADRIDEKKLERCTASATALVSDLSAKKLDDEHDASYGYAPVFTFTAEDGKEYTVRSKTYTDPPAFEKGDKVRLHYDPDDPTYFVVVEKGSVMNILNNIFRTLGALMIVVSIAVAAVYMLASKYSTQPDDTLGEYGDYPDDF